jgi:hypothetical protein
MNYRKMDWLVTALDILQESRVSCFVATPGNKVVTKPKLAEELVTYSKHCGGDRRSDQEGFTDMDICDVLMSGLRERSRLRDLQVLKSSVFKWGKRVGCVSRKFGSVKPVDESS